MHVTAILRPGLSDLELARAGAARGVTLRPLSPYYLAAPAVPALMLGFTGHGMSAMQAGLDRLVECLQAPGITAPPKVVSMKARTSGLV